MKGYNTSSGYMGYVIGEGYRLFETENAYWDWYKEAYPAQIYKGADAK